MNRLKQCLGYLCLLALTMTVGCAAQSPSNTSAPQMQAQFKVPKVTDYGTKAYALKMPVTHADKLCSGLLDTTCNAVGNGQMEWCNPFPPPGTPAGKYVCEFLQSDGGCTYTGDTSTTCATVSCTADSDCGKERNPDQLNAGLMGDVNGTGTCILTANSMQNPENFPGICFYPKSACSAGVGECVNAGTLSCTEGSCECTAQPLAPKVESCNGKDDNCNGSTDEAGATGCTPGYYPDADSDGFGSMSSAPECLCAGLTAGYSLDHTDCNDGSAAIKPGATEVCDGVDNNCDGTIDEGFHIGEVCTVGVGECKKNGTLGLCSVLISVPVCSAVAGTPAPSETCNGLDDNCNGQTDEGNPGGNLACNTGNSGICAAGTTQCVNNGITCNQTNGAASSETCNGLDDNCNGQTDEGNPGGGLNCNTGASGVCAAGTTSCTNHVPACNQNTVAALSESCNGLDDNCDGQTDEGNPGGGGACSTGFPGECAAGTLLCSSGLLNCSQITALSAEKCDNKDNDCNGVVDDGLGQTTCGKGVCNNTVQNCLAGVVQTCNPMFGTGPETCDGVDNNCDGQIDEGYGAGAACSAGQGQCSQPGTNSLCSAVVHKPVCSAVALQPVPETCDNLDNDCDGVVDNGCDNDKDGYCALGMSVTNNANCKKTTGNTGDDCDDVLLPHVYETVSGILGFNINPGETEVCDGINNNCNPFGPDKDAFGKSVCDSCTNKKTLLCGHVYSVDMTANTYQDVTAAGPVLPLTTEDAIDTYSCWSPVLGASKTLPTNFLGKEVAFNISDPTFTTFSLKIVTQVGNPSAFAFLMHGSCAAGPGKSVSAYNAGANLNGTCAQYSTTSVSNGSIANDLVIVDAASPSKCTVTASCK